MAGTDEVWKRAALAELYLEGVRGGIPLAAEQIEVMLRLIAAVGEPVARFMDLGCGNGVLAAAIFSRYPEASGTLVDFSEPMLAQARAHLEAHAEKVTLVLADFGLENWPDSLQTVPPFDVVVSGFAIHHQPDARKQAVYRAIFDLLRPGGVFLNIEHVAPGGAWAAAVFDDLFIDSLCAFHGRQGSDKTREQIAHEYVHRPDKAANRLAPVDVQCEWLREIGFADVDCYFKLFELAIFGGRRAP